MDDTDLCQRESVAVKLGYTHISLGLLRGGVFLVGLLRYSYPLFCLPSVLNSIMLRL